MQNEFKASTSDQLELLNLRDQIFALTAEEAERKFQYLRLRGRVEELNSRLIEQTGLLQINMTRAYTAEKRVVELQLEIDAASRRHQKEIALIHSSMTWKISHVILGPARWSRVRKRN